MLSTRRSLASELLDLRAYPLARSKPDSLEDFFIADGIVFSRLENEVPRSSLLRRSSHVGYEGRKLRGIAELKSEEF
jgi:hypothetical protein